MHSTSAGDASKPGTFGWRTGLVTSVFCLSLVLLVNVILAIVLSKLGLQEFSNVIYEGSCSSTQRFDALAHVGINILGVITFSSSNYFMQVLNASTRDEVDKAHSRRVWLDIGVPSVRNIKYISAWKGTIWACLLFASIPIHLL
jgi:hypothetical protein